MYSYFFTDNALRQISKLSKDIQKRIVKKMDYYCSQNNPLLYADNLMDYRIGHFRFRIGEYRVICDIEESDITVLAVGHRKDIYRKK